MNAVAADREHRSLLDALGASFPRLSDADREDIAQEAFLALLEHEADAGPVERRADFLFVVARNRALNLRRSRSRRGEDVAVSTDDFDAEDLGADPLARLTNRIDLDWLCEAVDALTPDEREAYDARFVKELDTKEAVRALGVPRSTYFHRLKAAQAKVEAVMSSDDRLAEPQRKLLSAYVAGLADLRERRRAKRLIAADPAAATLAREFAELHKGAAALLPPAGGIGFEVDPSIFERAVASVARTKDRILGATNDASEHATALASSGGGRGTGGVAGGGILAAVGGGGAKVAALCAGGAAAAACASAVGVLPGIGPIGNDSKSERPVTERRVIEKPVQAAKRLTRDFAEAVDRPALRPSPPKPEPKKERSGGGGDSGGGGGETAPVSDPVPSTPAPTPVTEQFDPLAGSSSATSSTAGSSSTSSTSSTGSGGSAAEQEFGGP